jgi:hypothetical protein
MFSHCPYNYLHILKKSLLQEHIKNCESKKKAEMIIDNKKLVPNFYFYLIGRSREEIIRQQNLEC